MKTNFVKSLPYQKPKKKPNTLQQEYHVFEKKEVENPKPFFTEKL